MRWCLSEAVLRKCRKKLQTCRSMVLIRDERNGQLMVRYRACLRDFSVLSGLLGTVQLKQGKSAEHLVQATEEIMKFFCTDCHSPPRGFRGRTRNQEDQELVHALQSKVHMTVTDCASAELLAQDISRGTRLSSTMMALDQPIFPNCKLVGRDRAHACCRLLEKPWKAEGHLNALMERTITGKNSICQKIWNSHTWSAWLEEAIVKSARPRGTRLCAAKHRFASYSTPLSRFILHLEPMVLTLNRIAASGVDAGWATEWLESVTLSDLLLLSMAADMAQSAIELTRFFDKEDMDIAIMNERVYQFCFELQAVAMFVLFDEKKCFQADTFTRLCVQTLKDRKLIAVCNGHARALQAENLDPFKAQALARIRACCCVCRETVQAEFPSFDAVMAFHVFSLHSGGRPPDTVVAGGPPQDSLSRLCQLFQVSPQDTHEQFDKVQGVARAHLEQSGCGNRDAWRFAIDRAQTAHWNVLATYLSFTASSSSVEQTFSKVDRCHLHRGNGSQDAFRRSLIGLVSHEGTNAVKDAEIIEEARTLFSEGRVNASMNKASGRNSRLDKGTKRQGKRQGTETAWLEKRRVSVARAVRQSSGGSAPEDLVPLEIEKLPEDMQKKCSKLQEQVQKRKIEAHLDGYLLEEEEKPGEKEVQDYKRKRTQYDKERVKQKQEVALCFEAVTGKKDRTFVHSIIQGANVWCHGATEEERNHLLNLGAKRVSENLTASTVFMVKGDHPEPRAQWHALVANGTLISRCFLDRDGLGLGHMVSYMSTSILRQKLAIFMTENFKAKNNELVSLLHSVKDRHPTCQWRFLDALGTRHIVLVALSEQDNKDLPKSQRSIYTSMTFLRKLQMKTWQPQKSGMIALS
eukprot:Skav225633  [mRNA]  locus=scaffold1513:165191:167925:- [translate_table: standard]